MKNILFITTNIQKINDEIYTGVYFQEFAVPYIILKKYGINIKVASILGGNSPIDENSLSCSSPNEWDKTAQYLKNTIPLEKIDPDEFNGVFFPGGHGPMFDIAISNLVAKIVENFYFKNKLIAAICHGVCGVLNAKDKSGDFIIKNKTVTAFTDAEEKIVKMDEFMPFSLQKKLIEAEANFIEKPPFSAHIEIDGNIITGQNQNSAQLIAEKMREKL